VRERGPWRGRGEDGKIILRWIIRKWTVGEWNGWSGIRIETGGGHL